MSTNTETDERDTTPPAAYPFMSPPEGPGELGWLGRYRIVRELGRGGFGAVFEAEDVDLCRRVAIKVILPDISADTRVRDSFLREARAAAQLDHPNINPIYDVSTSRNTAYIVMRLLQGHSLYDYLRHGPVPLIEAIRIMFEVARGLDAAHRNGLIHRDVKPGNIWLDGPNRHVMLLDFGLVPHATDHSVTASRPIVGTPAYMSPEQARGEHLTPRSDLFSLGVVLYEMVAGSRPFQGATFHQLLMAIAIEEPAPLRNVPPALGRMIMRLLAKNPHDRPPSAAAVAEELRRIEDDLRSPQPAKAASPVVTEPVRVKDTRRKSGFVHWAKSVFRRLVAARHPKQAGRTAPASPLGDESRAYLADLKWVNEQYNQGAWDEFAGNYIAVARKQLIDHGPDLPELRARAAAKSGLSADRILITYVEPPITS